MYLDQRFKSAMISLKIIGTQCIDFKQNIMINTCLLKNMFLYTKPTNTTDVLKKKAIKNRL